MMNIDLPLAHHDAVGSKKATASPRPDLAAATGIVTGVAISAGFWVIIIYGILQL
jgi:hypothetical protein